MGVTGRTFVDLFAGCGGLSLGLENAGWTPLHVNELSSDAMATYIVNRDAAYPWLTSAPFKTNDISQLVLNGNRGLRNFSAAARSELHVDVGKGELDLVCGGPPCQGYSGIGHRRTYAVERSQIPANYLFRSFVEVVSYLRPKFFLFENVRGILSAKWTDAGTKGEIFAEVLTTLKAIKGYRVEWSLLRAASYGVPQNRPRLIVVGSRTDLGGASADINCSLIPFGEQKAPDLVEVLSDLIDDDYENGGTTTSYPKAARSRWERYFRPSPDSQKKGSPLLEQEYSHHNDRILEKFKCMLQNGGGIPIEMRTKKFAQRLLPTRWPKSGPTITATSLPDDYVHFSQPRILTVREWARLQTFPDTYIFSGKRTTGGIRRAGNPQAGVFERELPKYTQIGNAVPVLLAQAIGTHLASMLPRC